jgi:hypothetical protein
MNTASPVKGEIVFVIDFLHCINKAVLWPKSNAVDHISEVRNSLHSHILKIVMVKREIFLKLYRAYSCLFSGVESC